MIPAEPTARPHSATTTGQAGADDRAEGEHQDEQRGRRSRSARRCRASGAAAVSGRSPPSSTWRPASRVGLDGLVQRREVLVEVGVGHRDVVLHGEQGGVAVGARARRGDRHDVVHRAAAARSAGRVTPDASRRAALTVVHDDPGARRCRHRGCARAAGRCRPGRGRRGCPSSPGGCRRSCRRARRPRRRRRPRREIVRQGWAAVERPRRWRKNDMTSPWDV